jgi:hypothetical protein
VHGHRHRKTENARRSLVGRDVVIRARICGVLRCQASHAGSPGSGGASPYPEPHATCAGGPPARSLTALLIGTVDPVKVYLLCVKPTDLLMLHFIDSQARRHSFEASEQVDSDPGIRARTTIGAEQFEFPERRVHLEPVAHCSIAVSKPAVDFGP